MAGRTDSMSDAGDSRGSFNSNKNISDYQNFLNDPNDESVDLLNDSKDMSEAGRT